MQSLTYQRCFNHATREAVARCPSCGHTFCRECVTEHDDKVICAACLRKLTHMPFSQRRGFATVVRGGQVVLGLVAAWLFFYLVGELLLTVPSSYHEATLWQPSWWD
jgi:hypothetical protein